MKTFFIDIDGVIYKDGKINDELLNIIKKQGDKIIFCTGRGYLRSLDIIKEYLDDDSVIIIENGSKIVDYLGNIIYFKKITNTEKSIIKKINNKKIDYIIFNPIDSQKYISYSQKKLKYVQEHYTSYDFFIKKMLKKDITQLTIKFKNVNFQREFVKLCQDEKINIKLSENFVNINAKYVSKKSAIIFCLKRFLLNLENIVIIGNDWNDLDMFDINSKYKIAVCDEYTPQILLEKANIITDFHNLVNIIRNL